MNRIPWSADLRVVAQRFGDQHAVADGQRRGLSYAQLSKNAHGLAGRLIAAGLRPGDPIATLLPNCLQAVWTSYGVRLSGAAEVSLNWGYTADEIAWSAQLVPFKAVLTDARRADELRRIGLEPVLVDELDLADDGATLPPVPAQAHSRMLFTSGTTGRPKAVVYDHGSRWAGEQLLRATLPFVPARGERIVLMTPFPHGASLLTYAWCAYGGEVCLLGGVELDVLERLLTSAGVDALFAPPTVLAKITTAFSARRFDGVRCVFTGTQALPASLYRKARAMFGPVVRITYGKSECVNPITVLEPADVDAYFDVHAARPGACVGWPASGVEIRINPVAATQAQAARDEGGLEAEPASGEVWLRARHMSLGMIGVDGFIAHEPEGWHRTGDLGYLDSMGRLVLTGREADVIKTGGYRVNPDEIEALLQGLERCGPVCVTSLESDYWGEVIIAVAEQAGQGWREQAIERVASLSQHKRPRLHVAVDALPRNPQGKINRREVTRRVLESQVFIDGPYPKLEPR